MPPGVSLTGGGGLPPFPNVDTAALESAASWLGAAATEVAGWSSDVQGVLGGPHWEGEAAARWRETGRAGAAELSSLSQAFSQVSQGLSRLAAEVSEQRRRFERAAGRYGDAQLEALAAVSSPGSAPSTLAQMLEA